MLYNKVDSFLMLYISSNVSNYSFIYHSWGFFFLKYAKLISIFCL